MNAESPEEEPIDIDITEDGEPWRSEFNFLLGRIKILEEKQSQQRKERVSFIDDVFYNSDPVSDNKNNNFSNTTDAEEANTNEANFRRHSLIRLILRGTGRQPGRAQSAPHTSLNASVARLQQLQESVAGLEEVDQLYDNFELPESTYTFLITEPILSMPFAVGCIGYGVVSYFDFVLTSHLMHVSHNLYV
jgi:hypothetical protein